MTNQGTKTDEFSENFQRGGGHFQLSFKADISGFRARSINLTVTAVMAGGTQLVEGAHLTGGDTRFCRVSSKSCGLYDRGVKTQYPRGNKHGKLV